MTAPGTRSRGWLFGPGTDLVLGCGLGYMAVFAALVLGGDAVRAVVPLGLAPLISVFAGTPHYGATLLRVYEQRSERQAYAFFAVWVTAFLWALYALGLYSAALGSILVSVYLTWSPWHYTGQNYGIALLFLRRRGIEVTPGTKRAIHVSFVVSFLLTFLAIHGTRDVADYAPIESYSGSVYALARLGIPSPFWEIAFSGLLGVYALALVSAARALLRRAPARELLPSGVLVLTQMLWFSLPPLARHWGLFQASGPLAAQEAGYAFVWVAAGHAVQYLWVTTYYAVGVDAPGRRRWWYYARCVCAGSAIWSIPALVYLWSGLEGSRFGGVANGRDTTVLLAAVVNLHHFMLDGAIWKLRDGRVARILIRRDPAAAAALLPGSLPARRRWLAPALLAAGALWTASTVTALLEKEFNIRRPLERGDVARARAATERLDRIRRAGPREFHALADGALRWGDSDAALWAYGRSLAREPMAATQHAIGRVLQRRESDRAAISAYEEALALDPDHVPSLYELGMIQLRLGEAARAEALLARAAALAPDREIIRVSLERARRNQHAGAAARPDGDGT